MSKILQPVIVFLFIISAFLVTSCDFSVDNPGPTPDSDLNQEVAFPSVVNGMERAMAEALNDIAYTGGAVSLEINAAGSITSFGITHAERRGDLNSTNADDATWNLAHQARYTAEDGISRMREQLDNFSSNELGAEGLLWVGYSNRLLGENFCKAVIDGGEAQPNDEHFRRAEEAFTEAISIAQNVGNSEIEHAALAGRASVNVFQGDWQDAVSDAQAVPDDFVFEMPYYSTSEVQYNRLFWANASQPYRAHTVYDTYYGPDGDLEFAPDNLGGSGDYYLDTGDSRVPYDNDPENEFGDTGEITWFPQLKYDARTSPITLSSGDEMKLIIAENEIREGRWEDAMTIINDLRATVPNDNTGGTGVVERTANNETEAWRHLKRERGIEMWLEARRLGDRRRWIENDIPGQQEDMSSRDLCWPISQTELESNPNVSPSDNDQDRAG